MATVTVTTLHAHPLDIEAFAHAVGAKVEWVAQLVEVGIVDVRDGMRPEQWRFESHHLQAALRARRLERDFGVHLDAAALILDLEHEVRRLKSLMHAHGL